MESMHPKNNYSEFRIKTAFLPGWDEKILFVCIDNEGYMNTGMQRSGTTPFGSWTSTTSVEPNLRGKPQDAKYMPLIMLMHNCEYVGTAVTAYMDDFHEKLEKAHQASKRGFAYLHVFSPCTTGWRFPGDKTIEVQRRAVASNSFPLWEYERQTGKLRFTHPVDNPEPIGSYIAMLGKFRHLSKDEIAHLQKTADDRIRMLKAIEASDVETLKTVS
jgi:phenylglyoxylate dehydrogenase beta subunit